MRLSAFRSIEVRERDFRELHGAAVRVGADDAAAVAHRHRLQLTGCEAVLVDLVDLDVADGVRELRQTAGTPKLRLMSPSVVPLIVGAVSVIDDTAGLIWPFEPNVKLVPTFFQTALVPVAAPST